MSNIIKTYLLRIGQFSRNARLYLASAILSGAAFGVYRLLFNFYALSLDLDQSIIGNLITINSVTALALALPLGYLADTLGRKTSLLLGGLLTSLAIAVMVLWPSAGLFYAMAVVMGAAQSLSAVSMAPFLLENSGTEERTYLFSLSQGLMMTASFVGNSIGGYLPTWIGQARGVEATSSTAYAGALGIIAAISALALLPLLALRTPRLAASDRSLFAPIGYAIKHSGTIGKMVLPMLITSIGAGLFMPFMNVFFRVVHNQPDPVIGNVLAWGALAMGVGLIIAPPIAERIGKIQLVVITQGLSIPFLIMLGYAPWFWMSALGHYVRLSLMNMGGPVYNAFVMESVEPKSRAMVASLTSMAWNFGWAFSPSISGWLQVKYGFGPVYLAVIVIYTLSVFLYWKFFWKSKPAEVTEPVPAD
ncbi:MAG: MFS transporter [Chloroflexi bacterium]|nr:MFS transporter [Chloroflexota bacterium]